VKSDIHCFEAIGSAVFSHCVLRLAFGGSSQPFFGRYVEDQCQIRPRSADNGDIIRVTKTESKSIEPASKGKPKFVGFRTLQGQHWWEKNYMQINAPQEKRAGPPDAANGNAQKPKRPKIFNVNPK